MYLLDPCLRLSLLHQCPAMQERPDRYPERESLFLGEDDGRFGVLLGETHLAAELMEDSSKAQGVSQQGHLVFQFNPNESQRL